jgi:hypothetical protein
MPSSATVDPGEWLDRQHSHSSIGQRIRGRPWGPSGTAPAVDEDAALSSVTFSTNPSDHMFF